MNKIGFDGRPALLTEEQLTNPEAASVGRRTFLTTSVAVGFALASHPVLAQAIHTDTDGMIAGEVHIPVPGGMMPAYQAVPVGPGPFPTIVVAHEIFGVHEHIQDLVRRFAKLGYFAIAPDLFARYGDPSKMSDLQTILGQVVSKLSDDQMLADLDSTVDYARSTGLADTQRLGVTGFCWGGRATWLYAAHNPKVKAAVAWYGLLSAPMWNPKGVQVFSVAKTLKVPVLGLFAGKDDFIPPADTAKLEAELKGSKSQVVVYPDVQHGFNADYRPSYDKKAAADGWSRMLAWFKTNGAA